MYSYLNGCIRHLLITIDRTMSIYSYICIFLTSLISFSYFFQHSLLFSASQISFRCMQVLDGTAILLSIFNETRFPRTILILRIHTCHDEGKVMTAFETFKL